MIKMPLSINNPVMTPSHMLPDRASLSTSSYLRL
jgi:hypothetical protein